MKLNPIFLVAAATFFLMGLVTGRHSRWSVEEHKYIVTARPGGSVAWGAGSLRSTRTAREEVYLPGIRICREEGWSDAVWVPVASPNEIEPHERVLAVVVRPSTEDVGWVVFESQRAVLLPRDEIARLLHDRFGAVSDMNKLIFIRSRE